MTRYTLGIAVLLLSASGAVGCRARAAAPRRVGALREDEIVVPRDRFDRGEARVLEAKVQGIERAIHATGRVAFDDQRVQHIFSPVAGQVTRVLAQPGQHVRRGAPLFALASPEVGSASADLQKARADLAQAKSELGRQELIVRSEAGTRRDLEAAQDAYHRAQAELARARQRMALLHVSAQGVTQEISVESALDGEVMARSVSPGMQLQGMSSGGSPIEAFTVGNIDRVWVMADVAEEDLGRVQIGGKARLRVAAWSERDFEGVVELVGRALDPATHTGRVRIAVENRDHALSPEMSVRVSFAVPAQRSLVVPRQAVDVIEGVTFAYVLEREPKGTAGFIFRRRRLRLSGAPTEAWAFVQDGLVSGDRVLVDDGARPADEGEVRLARAQFERAGLRTAPVGHEAHGDAVLASARIVFDDVKVAHVFSPVTGRVTRVLAHEGQRVKPGDPLLSLRSPEVGAAFADAIKAQADEAQAEHELKRQRELVETYAGARRDLEAAEATWRKAQAEWARARQKTRLLSAGTWNEVTQELTLRSPIDGEVVARTAAPGLEVQGQWSGSGTSSELFTIGSLNPLHVMGEIYEMDLPVVRAGQRVAVRVPSYPDRDFTGRIEWVAGALDPVTRMAKVRCSIENPGMLLRPEMAPILSIALPARQRLAVPRTAILRVDEGDTVFVAAGSAPDGQRVFRRRKVSIGDDHADGTVPILDGLSPGEEVVVSGGIYLLGLLETRDHG